MGYYINPPNETKEEWLLSNGLEVTDPEWHLLATNFRGAIGNRDGDGVFALMLASIIGLAFGVFMGVMA